MKPRKIVKEVLKEMEQIGGIPTLAEYFNEFIFRIKSKLPNEIASNELTGFNKEVIYLIAKHYPFSVKEVRDMYILTDKSVDSTVSYLNKSINHSKYSEELALDSTEKKLKKKIDNEIKDCQEFKKEVESDSKDWIAANSKIYAYNRVLEWIDKL